MVVKSTVRRPQRELGRYPVVTRTSWWGAARSLDSWKVKAGCAFTAPSVIPSCCTGSVATESGRPAA